MGFQKAGISMSRNFDLESEMKAVLKEIMDYKWLESEKIGMDIGMSKAAKEWITKYYDTWFQYNANKFMKD